MNDTCTTCDGYRFINPGYHEKPCPVCNSKALQVYELQQQKIKLLNIYRLFGGSETVNEMHININKQLESLGVDPNS